MSAPDQSSPRPNYRDPSLRALATYYRGQFAVDLANQIAYRGSLVIWTLGTIVEPLVFIVVWQAVAASRGGGMSAGEYAAYFIVTMFVNHMTFIWLMWEFEWRIRSGFYSPILLRPIHPVHNDISQNLSYKLVGLVGVVAGMIITAIVFNADFSGTRWQHVLLFVPALVMAMILRFALEWALACAAFWLTRVSALNQLVNVFFLFLGGQFAPLADMPGPVRTLAHILPFKWSIAFPVEVVLGRLSLRECLTGYAFQLVWIGIALLLVRFVWARAVRQYSAVGA